MCSQAQRGRQSATLLEICTAFANGKRHEFRLFKDSKTHIQPKTLAELDTGIKKIRANSTLPKKRTKNNPLTHEDKAFNRTRHWVHQAIQNNLRTIS
jgi:hypothetical protein